jgi:anaerobic ribonucleoside-triphosphate reductase
MSEQEIKTKIAELKEEMKNVHGTPTECFSRVVGYLRPVQNWNVGKKEEFAMRKTYHVCGPNGCSIVKK